MRDERRRANLEGPGDDPPGLAPAMRKGFGSGIAGGILMSMGWLVHEGPPPELYAFPIPWGTKLGVVVLSSAIIGGAWGGLGGAIGSAGDGEDASSAIFGGLVAAALALLLFATVISDLGPMGRFGWVGLAVLVGWIQMPLIVGKR